MKKTQTKQFKNFFKYGEIEVKTINSSDELVPHNAIDVTLPTDDKRALAIALNENLATIIVGEAGTGKTSAIKQLAFLRQQPYVRVNMTGFTTPDELIGSKSVKEGKTYFENGIITDAMQRGALLVIDEVNATSPDCLFILHGLLDEDKRITLPNGDIITPHENFRVFATCNPDYEGTKSMNKAFLDRFPIVITVDVLTPVKEKKLLTDRTGIDETTAENLVTIATMARKDYTEQKIMSYVSTRGLLNIAKLIQLGLSARHAYESTIVKKTNNLEERKILIDFFLAVMKLASGTNEQQLDVPYVTTKREIHDLQQRNIISEKNAEEYSKKLREVNKSSQELEIRMSETITLSEGYKNQTEQLQKEKEELQKSLKAYEKLEGIIQQVSKKITPQGAK